MAALYRQVGLEDVPTEALAPIYPSDHSRHSIRGDPVRATRPQIVAMGLADEVEVNEIDRAAREHLADPHTVVMSGLWFLAWGRNPT